LSAGKLLVIARNADFSLIVHQPNLTNYFLHFRVISTLMYYLRYRALVAELRPMQER
jgi:hypothetical protein